VKAGTSFAQAREARALSRFGSPEVRDLYDASFTAVAQWRNANEQAEMLERLQAVSDAIEAVAIQIQKEMSQPPKT
jgi:hypothetical protein